MSQKDLINTYLKTFGEKVGIDDLILDKDNFCGLVFGEKEEEIQINIEVVEEENMVCFSITLLELPRANREEIYRQMLISHLFGLETNGSFFGINPNTDEVLLCYTWPLERMEYQDFETILENVFSAAKYWKAELTDEHWAKLDTTQKPTGGIRV